MEERKGRRPDDIDLYAGERLRYFRTMRGMSQQKLAENIGSSFQQIQKYEKGNNRMSAGVLWRLSDCLKIPPSAFFPGREIHAPVVSIKTAKIIDFFSPFKDAELTALLQAFDLLRKKGGDGGR